MMRALVAPLLVLLISSIQGQKVLLNQVFMKIKPTVNSQITLHLPETNGYILLYSNLFQKSNSLDHLTKSPAF